MAAESGVTVDGLKAKITDLLQATYVDIEDMSGMRPAAPPTRYSLTVHIGGCGQAFSAVIVSPQFEKKTTLARNRLVNSALKSEIAAIHAWSPKCLTPEQWEAQRQEGKQAVAPGKDTTGEVVEGTIG